MTTDSSSKGALSADDAKNVGRGALYLTFTKFWFIITGFAIQFALPSIFSSDAAIGAKLYGQYTVVTGLSAVVNAMVVQGVTQAIARFSGRNPAEADGVRRAGYKLQTLLGGGLFALFFFGAPVIAERYYGNAEFTTSLRCAAFITLFYSFYAIFMGYLNGTKRFGRQALVDFSYSTLKVLCILGGAYMLEKKYGAVESAVGGFALASLLVLVLGYAVSGRAKGKGSIGVGELFSFQAVTMVSASLSTWLLRGDQQLLQSMLKDRPDVEILSGWYGAAMLMATIPYQAVFAITFVLFPLVSGTAVEDKKTMSNYIVQTTRYAAMIAMMIVAVFVAAPDRALTLVFKAEYAAAAPTLRILSIGYFFFSIYYVMLAIFTASGKPLLNLTLTAITVVVQATVAAILLRSTSLGMEGAAFGTLAGMVVGLTVAHFIMRGRWNQGLAFGRLAPVVLSGVVACALANALFAKETFWGTNGLFPALDTRLWTKLQTVLGFGAVTILYIVFLNLSGAMTADDRAKFKRVFKR